MNLEKIRERYNKSMKHYSIIGDNVYTVKDQSDEPKVSGKLHIKLKKNL